MPKPNPLSEGLEQHTQAVKARTDSPVARQSTRTGVPSRAGRVLVGGHFAPKVQTALKIIAAEERTTVQSLLTEGINTVFAKRGKPEIADIQAN